jgi:hypothetical protein
VIFCPLPLSAANFGTVIRGDFGDSGVEFLAMIQG